MSRSTDLRRVASLYLLQFRHHLLLLVTVLAAATILAACGREEPTVDADRETVPDTETTSLEHIHGLGVLPEDGRLFIATHNGLFAAAQGETRPKRISEHTQDIMGFSVIDPNRFIGSGHPSLEQDLPPHLGLIESRDGGRTWETVSLLGEVDFHALENAGGKIYGYDGISGRLMVSEDGGRNWQRHSPPAAIFDLAIDPTNSSHVIAATEQGIFVSANEGRTWRALRQDLAGLLAWPRANELYALDSQGQVLVSDDGGREWQPQGTIDGQPVAFIAAGADLYAALADGRVMRSNDGGDSWVVRTQAA